MPGVYKIPMVRMTEMSDETPECKGLKVPRSEMGVWVKVQAVRFSNQGCRAGNVKKANRRDATVPTDPVKPSD